jgi:hypothetical protein
MTDKCMSGRGMRWRSGPIREERRVCRDWIKERMGEVGRAQITQQLMSWESVSSVAESGVPFSRFF